MKNLIFWFSTVLFILTAQWQVCSAEPLTLAVTGIVALMNIGFSYISYSSFESNQPGLLSTLNNVKVNEDLLAIEKEIQKILDILPGKIAQDRKLDELKAKIRQIDTKYNLMSTRLQAYYKKDSHSAREKEFLLKNSLSNLEDGDDHPFGLIKSIDDYVSLNDYQSLLKYWENLMEKSEFAGCSRGEELQSFQQSLQKFLTSIAVSQVKAYLTIKMSAEFVNQTDGEYPSSIVDPLIEGLDSSFLNTLKSFKQIISGASRDVWRCDPREHKEGVTFIELKNTFQKQLVYEVMVGQDTNYCGVHSPKEVFMESQCPKSSWAPEDIPVITINDGTKRKMRGTEICDHSRKCRGLLRDCHSVHGLLNLDRDDKVVVCYSHPRTGRRFDRLDIFNFTGHNFEGKALQSFGKNEQCGENNIQSLEDLDIISKWGEDSPCYFYACTCDDEIPETSTDFRRSTDSYRYIYNGPITSDYENNAVVTGVRLAQRNGIIYPMIQQGTLLEEGLIDQSSLRWINVTKNIDFDHFLHQTDLFVKIEWPRRSVQLGIAEVEISSELNIPSGVITAITEIQLSTLKEEYNQPLGLIFSSRLFNFTTGERVAAPNHDIEDSFFTTHATGTRSPRDTINVENLRVPEADMASTTLVQTETRVNFSVSNFETDLGQTTIPFFDMQEVTTHPAVPMVAAGFYYKHREGFGGYVGIKMKTLDTSPYLVVPEDGFLKNIDQSVVDKLKQKNGRLGTYFNEKI